MQKMDHQSEATVKEETHLVLIPEIDPLFEYVPVDNSQFQVKSEIESKFEVRGIDSLTDFSPIDECVPTKDPLAPFLPQHQLAPNIVVNEDVHLEAEASPECWAQVEASEETERDFKFVAVEQLRREVKGEVVTDGNTCRPVCYKTQDVDFSREQHERQRAKRQVGESAESRPVAKKRAASSAVAVREKTTQAAKKPFSCDVCEREFRWSSDLKIHTRTHTGDKPFGCDACAAKFSQSSKLAEHKRIHTGDKPHVCRVCGAKFTQKGTLVAHARTHSGDKPYSCHVCGRKFARSSGLAVHLGTHIGGWSYSCETCGKHYKSSSSLAKHKRIQHLFSAGSLIFK